MDEFEAIASGLVTEAFENLTKAVQSMTEEERTDYARKFPIRIWTVAGISKETSVPISVN